MKKLALKLDNLLVESFDTTPRTRGLNSGTVRAHDSVMPIGDTSGSCQGTCYEATCENRTAGGEATCDTGCGGTQFITCSPTEVTCDCQTDATCYDDTCVGTCFAFTCDAFCTVVGC